MKIYKFMLSSLLMACAMAANTVHATEYKTHHGQDPHGLSFEVPTTWELDEEYTSSSEWMVDYNARPSKKDVVIEWSFPPSFGVEAQRMPKEMSAADYLRVQIGELNGAAEEMIEEMGFAIHAEVIGGSNPTELRFTMLGPQGEILGEESAPIYQVSNGQISMLFADGSRIAMLDEPDFEATFGGKPVVLSYLFCKGDWAYSVSYQALDNEYAQYDEDFAHAVDTLHFTK